MRATPFGLRAPLPWLQGGELCTLSMWVAEPHESRTDLSRVATGSAIVLFRPLSLCFGLLVVVISRHPPPLTQRAWRRLLCHGTHSIIAPAAGQGFDRAWTIGAEVPTGSGMAMFISPLDLGQYLTMPSLVVCAHLALIAHLM